MTDATIAARPCPDTPPNARFSLAAAILRRALVTALEFREADEDHHPVLRSINLDPSTETSGSVLVMATDRYSASMEKVQVAGQPFRVVLEPYVAHQLIAAIPDLKGYAPAEHRTVEFALDQNRVTVSVIGQRDARHTITFPYRQTQLNFPDLQNIFNQQAALEGSDRPQFGESLFQPRRIAALFAALADRKESDSEQIRIIQMRPGGTMIAEVGMLRVLVMAIKEGGSCPSDRPRNQTGGDQPAPGDD